MATQRKKRVTKRQSRGSRKYLYTTGAIVLVGLVVGVLYVLNGRSDEERVAVEGLSGPVGPGQVAFQKHCAECHGVNATGTDKGPPLVHRYYHPSHHADFSFIRAVRFGVRQHHWRFGNMPPQPKVTSEEMQAIIGYVRELQRTNGIF